MLAAHNGGSSKYDGTGLAGGPKEAIFSTDLIIDLGTENTRFSLSHSEAVWSEPSVLAWRENALGRQVAFAAGARALAMEGLGPQSIQVVRPLRQGVISDCIAALAMLKLMLQQHKIRPLFGFRRVLISAPFAIQALEAKAFIDLAWGLSPREAHLVAEPLAAAVGSGIPIFRSQGQMLVDIGKGIVEAVIMSQGHIVASSASRLERSSEVECLIRYFAEVYELDIGPQTAEAVKRRLVGRDCPLRIEVSGQSFKWQRPARVELWADELQEVLEPFFGSVLKCVTEVLERAPVELVTDICEQGLYVSGGGALHQGLLERLSRAVGLPVQRVEAPLQAVARGNQKILQTSHLLSSLGCQSSFAQTN